MIDYLGIVNQIMSKFQRVKIVQITQGQNKNVDSSTTLASSLVNEIPQLIKFEVVQKPNINPKVEVSAVLSLGSTQMDPILKFLTEDRLPSEGKEVDRVHRMAAQFQLSKDRRLYRRSFGGTYLLCLHSSKINELLAKQYEGVCGSHIGGQLLACGQ